MCVACAGTKTFVQTLVTSDGLWYTFHDYHSFNLDKSARILNVRSNASVASIDMPVREYAPKRECHKHRMDGRGLPNA